MNNNWVDVLAPRRTSSDILWIALNNWQCDKYKFSKERTPEQIRDDVFVEENIKVIKPYYLELSL